MEVEPIQRTFKTAMDWTLNIFAASMALKRFRYLLKCICLDDINMRMETKNTDKLVTVREMMENFVNNCQKYYCVGEFAEL